MFSYELVINCMAVGRSVCGLHVNRSGERKHCPFVADNVLDSAE